MKSITGAARLVGFDKPTVWSIMTPLAVQTKSINLGQGFPSWSPPDFYQKHLLEAINSCKIIYYFLASHQYTRAFGSLNLVQAIAKFHQSRDTYHNVNP